MFMKDVLKYVIIKCGVQYVTACGTALMLR